jgi:hypothetical protein
MPPTGISGPAIFLPELRARSAAEIPNPCLRRSMPPRPPSGTVRFTQACSIGTRAGVISATVLSLTVTPAAHELQEQPHKQMKATSACTSISSVRLPDVAITEAVPALPGESFLRSERLATQSRTWRQTRRVVVGRRGLSRNRWSPSCLEGLTWSG